MEYFLKWKRHKKVNVNYKVVSFICSRQIQQRDRPTDRFQSLHIQMIKMFMRNLLPEILVMGGERGQGQ